MTAQVLYLPSETQDALHAARYLAECGVRLFVADPAVDETGAWDPEGGTGGTGYRLPVRWQQAVADPRVVDRWKPGMALCAVMGDVVDGLDVDPAKGGDRSVAALRAAGVLPRSYGRQVTPSGGTHDLVAALGVRSRDGLRPGVDYKAGVPGEGGWGFLFLAPTVKKSKVTGELGRYRWEREPDLDALVLVGGDDTGAGVRALLERGERAYEGPTYVGAGYAHLSDGQKEWARSHVQGLVDYWRVLLSEAATWPEGQRDAAGRGWEGLARDAAWSLARLAVTPWTPLEEELAGELYTELLGVLAQDPKCAGKWDAGLLERAAALPVEPPPWDGMSVLRDRSPVDVTNPALATEWLVEQIGQPGTPLAGLFRRGEDLVHTPRIGEEGYLPPERGDDGPAQVRVASAALVRSRVQLGYQVGKRVAVRGRTEPAHFPAESVALALGDVALLPYARELRGITHTPTVRADGSVLDCVGYDTEARMLFLPENGLSVAPVPAVPGVGEVAAARELLLSMLADFPWNTEHDRANYLGLLLTPLLRNVTPPPYKLGLVNAHQRGSGKSLLAWILRSLHGGVLRGDVPRDGEEYRKQITAVLTSTTAPVVQFDNVRHLEATQLDALLTSDTWSDRRLGASEDLLMRNDRLWIATGNNISLGGDLVRRALWVSIDPQVANPEERTDFQIPDLKAWVRGRRGELLGALLTLVRAWVVAGKPGVAETSDDYGAWMAALRGILEVGGVAGVVGHRDTQRQRESSADEDRATLYQALWERYGDGEWKAADVEDLLVYDDIAPEGMKPNARSIGRWLANHQGQWAGGLCVKLVDVRHQVKIWRLQR